MMTLWIKTLAVIVFSSDFVCSTYQILNFGGALNQMMSTYQRPLCLINQIWMDCPVLRNDLLDIPFIGMERLNQHRKELYNPITTVQSVNNLRQLKKSLAPNAFYHKLLSYPYLFNKADKEEEMYIKSTLPYYQSSNFNDDLAVWTSNKKQMQYKNNKPYAPKKLDPRKKNTRFKSVMKPYRPKFLKTPKLSFLSYNTTPNKSSLAQYKPLTDIEPVTISMETPKDDLKPVTPTYDANISNGQMYKEFENIETNEENPYNVTTTTNPMNHSAYTFETTTLVSNKPYIETLVQHVSSDHVNFTGQNNEFSQTNKEQSYTTLKIQEISHPNYTDNISISYSIPTTEEPKFSFASKYIDTTTSKNTVSCEKFEFTTASQNELDEQRRKNLFDTFPQTLDKLERKFYYTTFNKLLSISPLERRENGISFVQSGLFLGLLLMAVSTDTDAETKAEIDHSLELNITDTEKLRIIKDVLSMLPISSKELKFRWASRLVLGPSQNVSEEFRCNATSALQLNLGKFCGNETDEELAQNLNQMVEKDSGGSIRDTFEPDELSAGVRAVGLTTMYLRSNWRSAPTVLNGTRPFYDTEGTPQRATRMIRVNDVMRYATFDDWHFQALDISYATPGLSLLMLIPHGYSLRPLAERIATTSVSDITSRMATMRVAATMPLYTLRMTLLLPSKLQSMGINKLISDGNTTDSGKLKLSHAVQRLMFWSEAGRNAFKDDGIEWDEAPELELVVDRPYLFFVRWHNITLMSGNFVL